LSHGRIDDIDININIDIGCGRWAYYILYFFIPWGGTASETARHAMGEGRENAQ
jgi:hypothetical protein